MGKASYITRSNPSPQVVSLWQTWVRTDTELPRAFN